MISRIKNFIRRNTKYGKSRYLNFLHRYDMKQFLEYSCMNENEHEQLATKIRILVHAIEKGMSLPSCRPGFGKEKVSILISYCNEYKKMGNIQDPQALEMGSAIINAYIEFQQAHGESVDFIPQQFLDGTKNSNCMLAGILEVPAKEKTNFEMIAKGRHSSRCYSERSVSVELVRSAVQLAQTAPSACNRQATRIYACTNREKIMKIIALHGGMRGFDIPGAIFVITGDLRLYQNEYERNTLFVDGGIFLMNLLYALDSLGLVACPLIWGSEPADDKKLSEILNIKPHEKIVAWISAGYCPGKAFKAAISSKRDLNTILRIIE